MDRVASPWTEMQLGTVTDPGANYLHNEDCCRVDPAHGLFVIADGVGGNAAGEVASELAIRTVMRRLTKDLSGDVEQSLIDALYAAHRKVRRAADRDRTRHGMATTILIARAFREPDVLWTAHVGNCRAYLFRDARMIRLTEDHTILNELRLAGLLPEEKADWPPEALLSQALGAVSPLAPEVRCETLRDGDLLLLFTDGVTSVLPDAELRRIVDSLAEPQAVCGQIARVVLDRGAPDNFTAIAARFLSEVHR
jgi:protein phosphatase